MTTKTLEWAGTFIGTDPLNGLLGAQTTLGANVPVFGYDQTSSRVTQLKPIDGFTPVVNVMDSAYGAKGDGVADDTTAIQAAMTAAAGKWLLFPEGKTFGITASVNGVSNVTVAGYGATLKPLNATRVPDLIKFFQQSNVRVYGLTVDCGQTVWATYSSADNALATRFSGVRFEQTSDFEVMHCTFTNLYTDGVFAYTCSGGKATIAHNRFTSPAQAHPYFAELVSITSCSTPFTIFDNHFVGTPSPATHPVASGTVSCAAGVATFSASQAATLVNGSGVVVGATEYVVTQFSGTLSCTLTDPNSLTAPTFAASAFTINDYTLSAARCPVAVFVSGTTGLVSICENTVDFCGKDTTGTHQQEAFCFYGNSRNVRVQRNVVTNCTYGFVRLSNTSDADVSYNYVAMARGATPNQQFVSIESTSVFIGISGDVNSGCQRDFVHHNVFRDDYSALRVGVVAESLDYGVPLFDITIDDNVIIGTKFAVSIAGPWKGVKVRRNAMRGSLGSQLLAAVDGGVAITNAAGGSATEANSSYDDLEISDNLWDVGLSGAVPLFVKFIKWDASAYTGNIGDVVIENNKLRSAALTATQAIAYRGVSGSPKGKLVVRRNRIDNYSIGFDATSAAECDLESNRFLRCTTPVDTGNLATCTLVHRQNNRLSASGAIRGTAQFTAGAVTLTSSEILAGDIIRVTPLVSGGTPGHIRVGTVTAASAPVSSTSATDTSTFTWEVLH